MSITWDVLIIAIIIAKHAVYISIDTYIASKERTLKSQYLLHSSVFNTRIFIHRFLQ